MRKTILIEEVEEFLDWLVSIEIQHYSTKPDENYVPSGKSHFYLKYSQERFTSEEIIKIFLNKADDELHKRWLESIDQTLIGLKQ